MCGSGQEDREIVQFILDKIDSVPHLEALLLLWNSRPKPWTPEELAARLYVQASDARRLLEELRRSDLMYLLGGANRTYGYQGKSEEQDRLMARGRHVPETAGAGVTIIHNKAPSSVRDFARAFRFTKERE